MKNIMTMMVIANLVVMLRKRKIKYDDVMSKKKDNEDDDGMDKN